MFQRIASSCLLLSTLAATACNAPSGSVDPAEGTAAEAPPEEASSDLTKSTRCEGTDIFVKYGLFDDLKAAVDPKFSPGYYVDVPGSLRAFVSYGGDMVTTVAGAGASAERVFDVSPGGAFHGEVGGAPDAARGAPLERYKAAKALYEAMTRATETSKTQSGVTWTHRTSPGGRVRCERYVYGSKASYTCGFSELLYVRGSSLIGAVDFCPSR